MLVLMIVLMFVFEIFGFCLLVCLLACLFVCLFVCCCFGFTTTQLVDATSRIQRVPEPLFLAPRLRSRSQPSPCSAKKMSGGPGNVDGHTGSVQLTFFPPNQLFFFCTSKLIYKFTRFEEDTNNKSVLFFRTLLPRTLAGDSLFPAKLQRIKSSFVICLSIAKT